VLVDLDAVLAVLVGNATVVVIALVFVVVVVVPTLADLHQAPRRVIPTTRRGKGRKRREGEERGN